MNIFFLKNKNLCTLLICLFGFLLPVCTIAQTGNGTLDRQQIVLGEQAKLHLKIADIPSGYELTKFYGWDTSSHHVEIISQSKIDTVNLNNQITYLQDWTVTSFDSGKWSLPVTTAILQNTQTGKQLSVRIDSVYLNVMPVDISNMKDYHDIKDILIVKYFNPFWIIVGVVTIVVLILLFLLIRFFIRKKKKKPVVAKRIKGSALDWALEEIEKLKAKKLSMYHYFGELNEIVRGFLHERAELPTQQETSDEIIMRMRERYSSHIVSDSFYQNLKLMDAVKFAKYLPSEETKTNVTAAIVDALKLFDKNLNETQTNK